MHKYNHNCGINYLHVGRIFVDIYSIVCMFLICVNVRNATSEISEINLISFQVAYNYNDIGEM